MNKLLSANFARLWKNKTFWLGVLFMSALAVYTVLNEAFFAPSQNAVPYETLAFSYSQLIGFCCAVFASLFLGTEYGEGTIRNKVIAGHSRARIYLANLTAVFTAMLLMIAAWLLGALVGMPFFGGWDDLTGCMVNFMTSLFTTAAFSAIFTLIAMLCTNKAVSVVVSILVFLGLSAYTGNSGSAFTREALPTGQVVWIVGEGAGGSLLARLGSVLLPMLGSTLIAAAVTGVGVALFQKKDLK